MNTTATIKPPPPPGAGHEQSVTPQGPASEFPPLGKRLSEVLPLIFVVPVAGPPVILLLGPLLLLVLLLIPPTAFLITLLVVSVLAAVLVVAIVALVASPYLLVRHLRRHRTRPPERRAHVPALPERRPIGASVLTQRADAGLFGGATALPSAAAHVHNDAQTHLTSERI